MTNIFRIGYFTRLYLVLVYQERSKILLEENGFSEEGDSDDESSSENVLDLDVDEDTDNDEDDSERLDEDGKVSFADLSEPSSMEEGSEQQEEEEKGEDVINEKSWGRRKSIYYNQDDDEKEEENSEEGEEQGNLDNHGRIPICWNDNLFIGFPVAFEEEEKEVERLKMKRWQRLTPKEYFDDPTLEELLREPKSTVKPPQTRGGLSKNVIFR